MKMNGKDTGKKGLDTMMDKGASSRAARAKADTSVATHIKAENKDPKTKTPYGEQKVKGRTATIEKVRRSHGCGKAI